MNGYFAVNSVNKVDAGELMVDVGMVGLRGAADAALTIFIIDGVDRV
jgi:hypothetical protein